MRNFSLNRYGKIFVMIDKLKLKEQSTDVPAAQILKMEQYRGD